MCIWLAPKASERMEDIGLFVLFNSMNIENKLDQVLSEIGEKSFGIYLIHMVIINLA